MSNSIWVIERGEYSDYQSTWLRHYYRVVGVFSSRENAERALAEIYGSDPWGRPEISEWPLDPGIDALNEGLTSHNEHPECAPSPSDTEDGS